MYQTHEVQAPNITDMQPVTTAVYNKALVVLIHLMTLPWEEELFQTEQVEELATAHSDAALEVWRVSQQT